MTEEDREFLEVIEMMAKIVEMPGGLDGLLTCNDPQTIIALRMLIRWNREVLVANMARYTHIARPRQQSLEGGRWADDMPASRSIARLSLAPVIA